MPRIRHWLRLRPVAPPPGWGRRRVGLCGVDAKHVFKCPKTSLQSSGVRPRQSFEDGGHARNGSGAASLPFGKVQERVA